MDSAQNGNLTNFCQSFLTSSAECPQEALLPPIGNIEGTKLFLCKDALLRLPFCKKIEKYFNDNDFNVQMPFVEFVKTHTIDLISIQEIAKIKLILIQKNRKKSYSLLFDGRFFDFVKQHWKLKVWTLSKDGCFVQSYKKIEKVPKLRQSKKFINKTPLWKLLNLDNEKEDPQTPIETVEFLNSVKKEKNVSVTFLYKNYGYKDSWHEPFQENDCVKIEAFTLPNYTIGFQKANIEERKKKEVIESNIQMQIPPSPTQQNKSSSVNVKLSGLNEAFNLGLINLNTFTFFSQELSKTVGTLHLELDDANNARYATYKDSQTTFQTELKNLQAWKKLFDIIYQQKKFYAIRKEKILQGLLQKLMAFQTKLHNPYKKCLYSLNFCIKNFKIILYSDSDFPLHALKLHWAHYLNSNQQKIILTLNTNAKNDITCIKNPDITVFNLYSYIEDANFFKSHLPAADIQSTRPNFKHQKIQMSGFTTLKHCKQRGQSITMESLELYQKVASDFVKMFCYDVCSIPYLSLASLAFQVLWTQYSRLGGHYHHGLEKTKVYYEDILRQYSQGGYYFSCKSKLDAGEPIHNTHGNLAASLFEYDIISSYGAASSQISTPTGFCYGYFLNNDNKLVRCDKLLRHTTFEFLSVFYTIDFLNTQGYQIQTCYSNFHQTGIFSIGNYPIDLVIIGHNGKVLLYQFDGQVNTF